MADEGVEAKEALPIGPRPSVGDGPLGCVGRVLARAEAVGGGVACGPPAGAGAAGGCVLRGVSSGDEGGHGFGGGVRLRWPRIDS